MKQRLELLWDWQETLNPQDLSRDPPSLGKEKMQKMSAAGKGVVAKAAPEGRAGNRPVPTVGLVLSNKQQLSTTGKEAGNLSIIDSRQGNSADEEGIEAKSRIFPWGSQEICLGPRPGNSTKQRSTALWKCRTAEKASSFRNL